MLAGALGLVYLIVVPSLQNRLVDSRLSQLKRASDGLARELPADRFRWPDFLDSAAESANARVVIYDYLGPPTALVVVGDSRGTRSTDVERDRLALRAASTGRARKRRSDPPGQPLCRGRDSGGGHEHAAARLGAAARGAFRRFASSVSGCSSPARSRLPVALGVGYVGALLFARRLRRLETAAERIAAGQFDEPILDTGADEVGQLARTFDRMRVRLAALDHARREFIANASHELRTPLFSLGGFLELLTEEELDEETRREFLQTMREQVDRLAKLATELLDLSRVDAGQLRSQREPVDLAEVAETVVDEFAVLARPGDHPVELETTGRRRLWATSSACSRSAGFWSRTRSCTRRRGRPSGCAPGTGCSRSRMTGPGFRRST